MLELTQKLLRDPGSELVLGLVAPVGANLERLEADLVDQLALYGYTSNLIRLSALLRKLDLGVTLHETPELARINSYIEAGNRFRERTKSEEGLALWAMAEITQRRTRDAPVLRRTAHILRSIKHPDEARALRATYGAGFYLIGLSTSTTQKVKNLKQKGLSEAEAHELIERDAGEENDYGQHTRDAFELADVFIRQEPEHKNTKAQLDRFLRLVFGAVDETPTADEHAMFLAYASALRSADLSRQVGAVVWKDHVGVVATGCNDVPAAGGGLYWPGPNDQRDHALGHDANERHKRNIANEVTRRVEELLQDARRSNSPLTLTDDHRALIREACETSRLLDITEFGRAVHAEMDALLSCGRAGVDTTGATLFSTTFPCHNCTKHIVASGVRRVVYIEPYEKSQALDLHDDAITPYDPGDLAPQITDHGDDHERGTRKVVFEPFMGVGPRRFFDLFSMRLSNGYPMKRKQKPDGTTQKWNVSGDIPVRVPMPPQSYLEREAQLAQHMKTLLEGTPP
ncbi:MAG TPA: anti-phage dCTP deaminase [Kofleriaceae bacterium]|jgi:deoxycytidylate deaminase|nr:anti-phage dCTP deaminase [Kofleriaceae bacterium]